MLNKATGLARLQCSMAPLKVRFRLSALAILTFSSFAHGREGFSDPRYLQYLKYPSGSLSANFSRPSYRAFEHPSALITNPRFLDGTLRALLSRTDDGVHIVLANGSDTKKIFSAHNGNLNANLEALRDGKWHAIEIGETGGCGVCYHKTTLLAGEQWTYQRPLPKGDFRTRIRFAYWHDRKRVYSNEIETTIPSTKFDLAPGPRRMGTLSLGPGYLTYIPVRLTREMQRSLVEGGWSVERPDALGRIRISRLAGRGV
jgi:hypothetical protein